MDTYQIATLRPRERYIEFLRVPALRVLVVFAPAETNPA